MENENVRLKFTTWRNLKMLIKFHNVYLHLFKGMQVLFTDQINFWFCLIVWDGMGNWLFVVITYISSRHQTSGYYTRAKAVSYTRPTRYYALNPSDTFDIAMLFTRLAVTMHISMVHFLKCLFSIILMMFHIISVKYGHCTLMTWIPY